MCMLVCLDQPLTIYFQQPVFKSYSAGFCINNKQFSRSATYHFSQRLEWLLHLLSGQMLLGISSCWNWGLTVNRDISAESFPFIARSGSPHNDAWIILLVPVYCYMTQEPINSLTTCLLMANFTSTSTVGCCSLFPLNKLQLKYNGLCPRAAVTDFYMLLFLITVQSCRVSLRKIQPENC